MLRNKFRRFIGLLILATFGLAVFQYARVTSGSPFVLDALKSGFILLAFLAAVVFLMFQVDKRMKKREP